MPKVRITKEFQFEGAHALSNYDGKCRSVHGHSYKLYVTVIGTPSADGDSPKVGMLIDFTELKEIVKSSIIDIFDHALILSNNSPLIEELTSSYNSVVVLPFQPTCENMVIYFSEILNKQLPYGIRLFSLKLYETSSSYVEWFADDN